MGGVTMVWVCNMCKKPVWQQLGQWFHVEGLREEPQGWMIPGTKVKNAEFWNLFMEKAQHPQVLLDTVARQAMESMKDFT